MKTIILLTVCCATATARVRQLGEKIENMFKKKYLSLIVFLLSACNQNTVNNIDQGIQFTGRKLEQDYKNSRSEFEKKYREINKVSNGRTNLELRSFHDHLIETLNFIDSLKENINKLHERTDNVDSLNYIKDTFVEGKTGRLLIQKIIETYRLALHTASNPQQEKAISESMKKFSNSDERLSNDFNMSSSTGAIWILCSYEQEMLTAETSNLNSE
ncbi:hypothetical protein ACFGVR_04170 [Mucilaginibacter sp. AW1-3]